MSRQVSCPSCQAVYKLADNPDGKPVKLKCKKCDKVFVVGGMAKPAETGVQAEKKLAPAKAKQPEPVIRRATPPARKSAAPVLLIVLGLFVFLGLGAAGVAVGGYFLLFHGASNPPPLAQGDSKLVDEQNAKKDNKPIIEPKDKPVIEPKDKPVIEPKDKLPKFPPIVPKEQKKDPMPPVVVGLFKLKDPPTPPVALKLEESAHQMALAPDGKKALVGHEKNVLLVELPSGKTLKKTEIPALSIQSILLTPDGKLALVGGDDTRFPAPPPQARLFIRTVSMDTGAIVGYVKGPQNGVDHMAIAPDGTILACAESRFTGLRGVIRIIDLKNGATLFVQEKVHRNVTKGLALTPDKKYVISTGVDDGSNGSKVVVFDIAAKSQKHVFTGYPGVAEGLAVSSDGKYVAAAINNAGGGGSVRVWDIETGAEKLALVSKQGGRGARHVIFGPDNKTLLATFYDSSTRTFDLQTGNEEGGFRGHAITPNILTRTADATIIATAYFKELTLWQFPDALARLVQDDQPAFVQIVREGQAVEVKAPPVNPKNDPIHNYFVNATIEVIRGQDLEVDVNGARTNVRLQPTTKYFDAAGRPVSADQARTICRLGNVINVKAFKVAESPAVEVRLVRDGAADVTLSDITLKATMYPGAVIFKAAGKDLTVKLGPQIRYLDHLGKEMPGMIPQKFLNSEDIYAIKLHRQAGEDRPILVEARLTPPPGQLPVFLKYPLGIRGAKAIKNATITRSVVGGSISNHLVLAGAEPIRIITGKETKAYDVKGNEVEGRAIVFHQNLKVDAIIVPRGKNNLLLEARALTPFPEAKPPPVKTAKIVEHKGVQVVKLQGNKQQTFLKLKGKNVQISVDADVKALDKDGNVVATALVLQNGNVVDAKVEDLVPRPKLLEVRLVDGSTKAANSKTFEGLKVARSSQKNQFALTQGKGTLNVRTMPTTKAFDADGNPVPLDQVLRVGNVVDVVVEVRPNGAYPLLEVRAAKKK